MSHYLITGAAGFIAARTAELLLQDGHNVVGVDNMNDAYDPRIKEYRLERLQAMKGFTFHKMDVADKSIIEKFKGEKFDAIINLAARAGVRYSVDNPWVFVETNMIGTLNMLELCKQNGVKKFVVASTSSIYGEDPRYPTPESASSSEPLQPYAASKKGGEAMCHAYHHLYGIDVSILRYFTVYGPAGRPDLAHLRFVQWISEGKPVRVNGDGNQSRGFTYIDDIARGTILALKPLGFEIINLGGHEVITINNLIKIVEDVVGKKAVVQYGPPNPADMLTNQADVTKAGELLGWEAQYNMRAGVEKLVEWYNAEREWAKDILTP
ncbi:MAG: nucleotide sugar epimerase [Anaerolineae bacterium]|nr:MAG: nucleotide sugar epimerase [Anaerolineae bacterium]WKZ44004.1 MAG: SDR family NAD(P)-dependent oxidoreductase [Anaerolineales bacterium]